MTASFAFKPLPANSLIGVIAPAGPAEPARVAQVEILYQRFGYRCRIYPGCHLDTGYLAGPDAVRLADLHAALADADVAAIHALRGGYGCMRLLDGIDTALLRAQPKLLIGYSDITALHALWCAAGAPSLHAPMAASDMLVPGLAYEQDRDALFALLASGVVAGEVWSSAPLTVSSGALHVPGRAEGKLMGGNLSLIAAVLGTPWAWDMRGAVLFFEDVNEEPYRVDRLLTQLRLAGTLDGAAGFLLGSFSEGGEPEGVLRQMLCSLGKPVLGGWPTGHGTPNRPLPLGLTVRLDVAEEGGGSITWQPVQRTDKN